MKKRTYRTIAVVCLTAMLAMTGCKPKAATMESTQTEESGSQESNKVFGTFEAQTLDGETVTEEIFKEADLTMVNIWATFCNPCLQEMPDLGELSREYEEQGIKILGIVGDVEEPGDATTVEIVETTKADYTHLMTSPSLQLGILSQITAYPTTIFVDSEGEMVGQAYAGARSKEEWRGIIEEMKAQVS